MYWYVSLCNKYVLVHTTMSKYLNAEPCITGFRGAWRDPSMLESDVQQPSAGPGSDEGDYSDSCHEDEELFDSGPDAEVMEEAAETIYTN